jgi:hypothetical protein
VCHAATTTTDVAAAVATAVHTAQLTAFSASALNSVVTYHCTLDALAIAVVLAKQQPQRWQRTPAAACALLSAECLVPTVQAH